MKKKNLIFAGLFLLAIIFVSCAHSEDKSGHSESTAANPAAQTKSEQGPAKSLILVERPDNSGIIGSREWVLPPNLQAGWESAKEKTYADTLNFEHIAASAILSFTTASKDANNTIITKAEMRLLKVDKKYALSVTFSDQANMGTKAAFDTYIMATVIGVLKQGEKGEYQTESKVGVAYGKTGIVEKM